MTKNSPTTPRHHCRWKTPIWSTSLISLFTSWEESMSQSLYSPQTQHRRRSSRRSSRHADRLSGYSNKIAYSHDQMQQNYYYHPNTNNPRGKRINPHNGIHNFHNQHTRSFMQENDNPFENSDTSYFDRWKLNPPSSTINDDDNKSFEQQETTTENQNDEDLMENQNTEQTRRLQTTDDTDTNDNNDSGNQYQKSISMEGVHDGSFASQRLKNDLLEYYDRSTYPWEYLWDMDGSTNQNNAQSQGLPVEVSLNFHQVYSVDVKTSTMDLIVWFRMFWYDPRLTWDPSQYGNLTRVWFFIGDGSGGGGEMSEIWSPDLELWNMVEGLAYSLEDAYAKVSNEGLVYWSRPGHLVSACKFSGLERFPFDSLKCTVEIGSWAFNGKYIRPVKYEEGFSIGGSLTSGESYNEYSFAVTEDGKEAISCRQHVYPPYLNNNADWPVLLYDITVGRSWQPYVRGYIILQILLNLIGFSVFWLPPACGERMSLSITAMLASVTSEILVSERLPITKELTWYQSFSLCSMFFTVIALFESAFVLYFYYKRSEDLVPSWYKNAKYRYLANKAKKMGESVVDSAVKGKDTVLSAVGEIDLSIRSKNSQKSSLVDGQNNDGQRIFADDAKRQEDDGIESERGFSNTLCLQPALSISPSPFENSSTPPTKEKNTLSVSFQDEYIHHHLSDNERCANNSSTNEGNDPNRRSSASPLSPRDIDDFANDNEFQNNMRWKYIAARIDDVARFWIPACYTVVMAIYASRIPKGY